jgi:hypothetical protein
LTLIGYVHRRITGKRSSQMKRSLRVSYRGFPTMAEARIEVYIAIQYFAELAPTAEYTRHLDSKVYDKLYQSCEKRQRRQTWRGIGSMATRICKTVFSQTSQLIKTNQIGYVLFFNSVLFGTLIMRPKDVRR